MSESVAATQVAAPATAAGAQVAAPPYTRIVCWAATGNDTQVRRRVPCCHHGLEMEQQKPESEERRIRGHGREENPKLHLPQLGESEHGESALTPASELSVPEDGALPRATRGRRQRAKNAVLSAQSEKEQVEINDTKQRGKSMQPKAGSLQRSTD